MVVSNKELAEELHKLIIRTFKKRNSHSPFIDDNSGADLADMQVISKFNKRFDFYYVLLIFIANILGVFL